MGTVHFLGSYRVEAVGMFKVEFTHVMPMVRVERFITNMLNHLRELRSLFVFRRLRFSDRADLLITLDARAAYRYVFAIVGVELR